MKIEVTYNFKRFQLLSNVNGKGLKKDHFVTFFTNATVLLLFVSLCPSFYQQLIQRIFLSQKLPKPDLIMDIHDPSKVQHSTNTNNVLLLFNKSQVIETF